ncbi:MAG TPA: uracil-DNA glycosylase family protein [Bacteroidales bacterium]|nr:uracil-DNA glycosylase family protein [Bacteroidales bacterium]
MSFAEKAISFYKNLEFSGKLPDGIQIMNPFRENPDVIPVIIQFFNKFYNELAPRHLLIGINPGRFGAGSTGIPFTDTKRLAEKCGINIPGIKTFEPSSAFMYEMIDAYGGVEKFYSHFYVSAVSPLGFTREGRTRQINYNYYDSRQLTEAVIDFIESSLEKQLEFGILRDICFCLGTGKNFKFLNELNKTKGYFDEIIPLEHPRFIMQYRSKQKQAYISKYLQEFKKVKDK